MKLVIAIVQSDKLEEVKQALRNVKVGKITVSDVIGCGAQVGKTDTGDGIITEGNLLDVCALKSPSTTTMSNPHWKPSSKVRAPAISATVKFSLFRWRNASASAQVKPDAWPSANI